MNQHTVIMLLALAGAGPWTAPVEVQHEFKRVVSYRARLAGEYLVVEALHEAGWHTVAMDNDRRVKEKLKGRPSLAVDTPTQIQVSKGLQTAGPWHQSPPKDFSRPELELFSWGFDGPALFAAKVRRTGAGPARVAVSGQACTETLCKKFELEISLPLAGGSSAGIDLKSLVPVR
jgi:hypothetical protein